MQVFCLSVPYENKNKKVRLPHGGLYGFESSRIPYCLDNRLIDSSKVVSPKHRPHFATQGNSWYSFLRGSIGPMVMMRQEGFGELEKFNNLIGFRTHNIPVCSLVPSYENINIII
jgi:hypothetical protein